MPIFSFGFLVVGECGVTLERSVGLLLLLSACAGSYALVCLQVKIWNDTCQHNCSQTKWICNQHISAMNSFS